MKMRYMTLVSAGLLASRAVLADPSPQTVEEAFPDLASGVLAYAKVGTLPEGTLLRSGAIEITVGDLDQALAGYPAQIRAELAKNRFFVLEQDATEKLLAVAARQALPDAGPPDDSRLIQDFFGKLTEGIEATGQEQKAFFDANPRFFPGVPFGQVQPQIANHLAQEKRQHFVEDYIRSLGQGMEIEVSGSWTEREAVSARDNPLDKARRGGRPLLAVFNATTPCCPDTVGPVAQAVGRRFGDRLETVSLNPGANPVLAARYRIRGNPVLLFYGADGEEAYRHQGAMGQDEMLAKLAELGVE